jgi:RNA polymerase sigma-70 factor (ECF subfamily)
MTQADPQYLAQCAAQRDQGAFAQLYDEHLSTVYRYVFYKVGDPALAEDLTAEVFSKAWEAIDKFQWRNLPFQHWLLRIARNVVVDHWRLRRRATSPIEDLREAASDEMGPDERVALDFEVVKLRTGLAQLPDEQRDVLILRFIEGYSHADAATVLGKSVVAVRQIQVRALRALNKILTQEEETKNVAARAALARPAVAASRGPSEEPAI